MPETKSDRIKGARHSAQLTALDFIKYIGPGFLITIGFIDPGNWAANLAAGSTYGYSLLWVITLSTILIIILQHNSAHLGIVTGYCLSEAATIYLRPWISRIVLGTAVLAAIATATAEILGGAIALRMLFGLPIQIGIIPVLLFVVWMLWTNSYKRLERWLIGFVSIIGISLIIELILVRMDWRLTAVNLISPQIPHGSLLMILGVIGAVVMPHNLFLHSEVIQSRQWNLEDDQQKAHRLKYEFFDTLFSMIVGGIINIAMIVMAAATFFQAHIRVTDLSQAERMLRPLLGDTASLIFAVGLLFAGISSAVTAGMAGGSIVAGLFKEPYDIRDSHTRLGVIITIAAAALAILFINNPFNGLIYSQVILGLQLPFTVFLLISLTSSGKLMGSYRNSPFTRILLWGIGIGLTVLNAYLLFEPLIRR